MNNCSLFTSNFPTARKLAEAVPFTKKGDHKIASNNRPLSLPPVLSKICDKAVLAQFITYLYKHAQAIIQPPELDLGLGVDSYLTFNEQRQQLSASCTAKLCHINRVKHVFNQETLSIIINALVMSKIDCCCAIWSSTGNTLSGSRSPGLISIQRTQLVLKKRLTTKCVDKLKCA